MKLSYRSSYKT